MKVHEFQAKEVFARFGIPTPQGGVGKEPDHVAQIADKTGAPMVLKAQIHAGGRGKGRFKEHGPEGPGGVVLVKDPSEVRALAEKMLGSTLVTHQSGPEGRVVKTLLVEGASSIKKEYYAAIVLDRASRRPVLMASTEGGMDIEKVAEETPEKILKEYIDPAMGLQPFQARRMAYGLGLPKKEADQATKIFLGLDRAFWGTDATLAEINPLVVTTDGKVLALDAKMNFDDSALFRHPEIAAYRDVDEEDPTEAEANELGISFVSLEGNIGCMVNGAGLAMATMDIILHAGGEPANFLDVGGTASVDQVSGAFRIILKDPKVKAILVNIFGGIMDCGVIAQGIVQAVKLLGLEVPVVVRLEGNNVAEGKRILEESGLKLEFAPSMAEAAKKVVQAAASHKKGGE